MRWTSIALIALLLLLGLAGTAQAQAPLPTSPWTFTDEAPALLDASCATAGTCVAVGQQGRALRTTGDADAPLAWSAGVALAYPEQLSGVACTGRICVAVSSRETSPATYASKVYRSTDGGATFGAPTTLPQMRLPGQTARFTRSASAVACDRGASPVCYVVGSTGGIWRSADAGLTWTPLQPGTAWNYTNIDCPAAGRCAATVTPAATPPPANAADVVTITGTDVTAAPKLSTGGWSVAGALACDTATRCVVADITGHFALLSLPGGDWGDVRSFPVKGTTPPVIGDLSCGSANTCVALSAGVVLRTTTLGSADGGWKRRPNGAPVPNPPKVVACASPACVLVGNTALWIGSLDDGFTWADVNRVPELDVVDCAQGAPATCLGGGMGEVGATRSGGELWGVPLEDATLSAAAARCTDDASSCLLVGGSSTLQTSDLITFAGRFPPAFGPSPTKNIACPTVDVCVSVDKSTITTLNGGTTQWGQTAFLPAMPASISCVPGSAPLTCLAPTTDGYLLRGTMTVVDDRARWNWVYTDVDADSVAAVGCSPAPVRCTAVAKAGVIYVSDPADPTLMTWTKKELVTDPVIDNRPNLVTVDCPTSTTCVAGGAATGLAAIASTTDGWATYSYDTIDGIKAAAPTIKDIDCTSGDRCMLVGSTVLIGRSSGVTPAR